jgi:hypothetical protein
MVQLDATHSKFIQLSLDKERWINFVSVASSWIISLPSFTMHGLMNIKFTE